MCRPCGSPLRLVFAAGLLMACRQEGREPPPVAAKQPSFSQVAARLLPSVVGVLEPSARGAEASGTGHVASVGRVSLGAGFVVDKHGHIVTNRHVVGEAQQVLVEFSDGRRVEAAVVGKDDQTDLAVLRVAARGAPSPLPLGDSDGLAVGDWVLAAGSPYGLSHSLSAGIVSAKGRREAVDEVGYGEVIQTDAAINPGNSGGPLVDLQGRVVGVSAAMRSGARGIGFAIPVNTLREVLPSLIRKGRVARSWIGIFIDEVDEAALAGKAFPNRGGAVVSRLVAGGPAERADLRPGDVILAFNGHDLRGPEDLPGLVTAVAVGQTVAMRIWRDGVEREVTVKTVEKPADAP